MPPTLFGKELNYYGPHKDTKQRPTALWAAVDSQPNIWWCSKIQAAAVLQHFRLHCCSAQLESLLQISAGPVLPVCTVWQTTDVDTDTGPSHHFE